MQTEDLERGGLLPLHSPNQQWRAAGQAIAARRRAAGLSQRELARAVGIRPETLSHLECGRHRPSPAVIARLEACLSGDATALVHLTGHHTVPQDRTTEDGRR